MFEKVLSCKSPYVHVHVQYQIKQFVMHVYDTIICCTRFVTDTRGRAYGSVLVACTFVTIQ